MNEVREHTAEGQQATSEIIHQKKALSPEWAEAANEAAGENRSQMHAWMKLRMAEMKWAVATEKGRRNMKHLQEHRSLSKMQR